MLKKKNNYLKRRIIKQKNLKYNYIFYNYSIILTFFNEKKIIIDKFKISLFFKQLGIFFISKKISFLFLNQKLLK